MNPSQKAFGLICLDNIDDERTANQRLKVCAAAYSCTVVETLTFHSDQVGWIYEAIRTVHATGARAVVVADQQHLLGFDKAIVGVADLITPSGRRAAVGY